LQYALIITFYTFFVFLCCSLLSLYIVLASLSKLCRSACISTNGIYNCCCHWSSPNHHNCTWNKPVRYCLRVGLLEGVRYRTSQCIAREVLVSQTTG